MNPIDAGSGATAFFTPDHRRCDELWAAFEAAASAGDEARAQAELKSFEAAMLRHFAMEEEVLFPALDEATGMRGVGPVAVMLHEHAQMRALLTQMAASARLGELETVLDQGDTLLMVIQQHNAKEEGMLYPMADSALSHAWPTLAGRLARY